MDYLNIDICIHFHDKSIDIIVYSNRLTAGDPLSQYTAINARSCAYQCTMFSHNGLFAYRDLTHVCLCYAYDVPMNGGLIVELEGDVLYGRAGRYVYEYKWNNIYSLDKFGVGAFWHQWGTNHQLSITGRTFHNITRQPATS